MSDISFIFNRLSSKIIRHRIAFSDLPDIKGILFLKNQNTIPADYLFIANGEELGAILNRINPSLPVTIFTSGDYGDLPILENNKNINTIATSLEIFDLYNEVNEIVVNYQNWSLTFMRSVLEGWDLKYLISQVGIKLKAPVFLLNASYGVICSNTDYLLNDVFIDEMLTKGCLSLDSVKKLFSINASQMNGNNGHIKVFSEITRNTYNIETLTYKENAYAFLILITNSTHSAIDVTNLVTQMAGYVKRLLSNANIENDSSFNALSSFISDVVELRLVEPKEIENRLKLIQYPLKVFFNCLVIQFSGRDIQQPPYGCIIDQLEQILPGNNITVYDGDIIILFSYEKRTWHFELDYEKLEALLDRYDAYAGISNGTKHPTMIRTMYLLAKSTARLGRVLRTDKSKRIFTNEEYSMYFIIDLCARNFCENYKHDNIIYLSHPAIIAIARYDRKHNSNLRDTLFYYLINDRNLIKTSKALYMHRNTILNKINKITEIVGESLDNGQLQLRLLFSCLLLRYYEDYMKEDINDDI